MTYDIATDNIDPRLRKMYDDYVEQIVHRGCDRYEAAMRIGISADDAPQWVRNTEIDKYFVTRLEQETAKLDPQKAWTANTAIVHLLRLVENQQEKGTVKLGAIDRLNVLLGITVIDKDGNTRKSGPSFEELMRMTPSANGAASSDKMH